ncbi:hypothetical protein BESB_029830 [Besnoitia besnoiti]|uniref:Uncharacterized protein n=1 Tax=Besnoitia besnoiti TaxID=94643 RepID=A0A2A9LZD9_BESBE|nr:hypothetical protein BESB_029830 [Besnoitia besnoiti]PFH31109.1 hypothetical protein BESB_029830 [Besnoitia besnoiti]
MLLRHSDRINIAFADAASLGWPDPKGQPASSTNAPSAAATSSRQGRAAFNSPRLGDGRAGGAQVSRGFPAGFIQQRGLELPVKGHNLSHNPREDREARLKGLREGDRSAGKRPGGARFSALQLRTTASVPRVNVAPVQFKDIGEAARSRIAKMLGVAAPGAPIMHENPNLRVGDFVVMATYVVPKGPDSLFKALSYAFVGFTSASNAVADALLQEVEAEGAPGPELLQGMSSQQLLQTASDVFDLNVVVFGTPPRPPVHVYEPSLQSGIFYGPSVFLFEDADGDFSVVTEAAPRTAGSASTSGSQPATPSAPPPPSTSITATRRYYANDRALWITATWCNIRKNV